MTPRAVFAPALVPFTLASMASTRNDALTHRTVEGSVNFYDKHACSATANDKGLAARLGGLSYNPINHQEEHYFKELRSSDHFVDANGNHTEHYFGCRRRKFGDHVRQSELVRGSLVAPDSHPRDRALEQRRTEIQLAQSENFASYSGYQKRSKQLFPEASAKRDSIHNQKYAYEKSDVRPQVIPKQRFQERRGETMGKSSSAPSLSLADPVGSLQRALERDGRKEASQRQTESGQFAPDKSATTCSYALDMATTNRLAGGQKHLSVCRVENGDFSVVRKNDHHCGNDKLTRSDPYYARPMKGLTNSSVKYDLISNERKWFRY